MGVGNIDQRRRSPGGTGGVWSSARTASDLLQGVAQALLDRRVRAEQRVIRVRGRQLAASTRSWTDTC
jgi:hypothetical protein